MFYPIFIIAILAVVVAFITAVSYKQLIIVAVFYPLLVYFGLILFPRKANVIHSQKLSTPPPSVNEKKEKAEKPVIVDLDKRAFLKLAAGAGISYFIYSILARKTEGLLIGGAPDSGVMALKAPTGETIHPAETQPTDGYQIVEIDESEISYFGFIDTKGNWFIMKEGGAGSFRYTKGQSNFPNSWNIRENLKYDYYDRVFL
ncbi:MAG TPA: hypothetical protein VMY36_00925 [Patescibacteria group bacterium]|nr:hypothetical protein [Patescibacteria group bacterium]